MPANFDEGNSARGRTAARLSATATIRSSVLPATIAEDDEEEEEEWSMPTPSRPPSALSSNATQGDFSEASHTIQIDDIAQAFSHFTIDGLGTLERVQGPTGQFGSCLVCDIQGTFDEKQNTFLLIDPVIHSNTGTTHLFGRTDRGALGIDEFLQSHKCNDCCRLLQLPHNERFVRERVSAMQRTSARASQITVIKTNHIKGRQKERGFTTRELQEAVKYGDKAVTPEGNIKHSTPSVVYVTDPTERVGVTGWRADEAEVAERVAAEAEAAEAAAKDVAAREEVARCERERNEQRQAEQELLQRWAALCESGEDRPAAFKAMSISEQNRLFTLLSPQEQRALQAEATPFLAVKKKDKKNRGTREEQLGLAPKSGWERQVQERLIAQEYSATHSNSSQEVIQRRKSTLVAHARLAAARMLIDERQAEEVESDEEEEVKTVGDGPDVWPGLKLTKAQRRKQKLDDEAERELEEQKRLDAAIAKADAERGAAEAAERVAQPSTIDEAKKFASNLFSGASNVADYGAAGLGAGVQGFSKLAQGLTGLAVDKLGKAAASGLAGDAKDRPAVNRKQRMQILKEENEQKRRKEELEAAQKKEGRGQGKAPAQRSAVGSSSTESEA